MARGQRRTALTTRPPTGTGTRKTRTSVSIHGHADENTPPAPLQRPKPVPKFKNTYTATVRPSSDAEDTAAAHALVSLQGPPVRMTPPSPLINRHIRTALKLPPGTNLEESEEEEDPEEVDELQESSDVEEEVDELLEDFDETNLDLTLPTDDKPKHSALPEFKVPLEVPYRQASRDVDGVTSKTSFARVLVLIAQRMDVSVTHLSGIGYIPSYKPKSSKPVPKLLEDESSWFKLLEDIHAYIISCKGKNGKGAVKPFFITIVDTTAPLDENKSQKKKKSSMPLSDPSPPALTSKESEQLTAFKKLEKRHLCQQHRKPCFVQPDGEHYHLTISDLTKWAHLMAENKALLDTPPEELKLTDANVRQVSIKKTVQPRTPTSGESSPPEWLQHLMGVMMVGNLATTTHLNRRLTPNTPSSPLSSAMAQKRPLSPLDYPSIDVWLQSIEENAQRSKKARGFAAFADHFIRNGIEDLEDFLRLSNTEILNIIPNINIGIANRLLAFAQEDISSLQHRKRIHF